MSTNLTQITHIISSLVKMPNYTILGQTHGRIVFLSTREGALNLWSMDLEGKDLKRLTVKPITGVVRAHPESPYIIFQRDISKGKELHRLFMVNVYGGGERLLLKHRP